MTLDGQLHLPNPSDRVRDRDAKALALVSALGLGKANITSGHTLARRLGIGQRAVGGVVHRARELGICVGSAHGEGYYLVQTEAELEETIEHITRRITGLRETAALLRIGFDKERPELKREAS